MYFIFSIKNHYFEKGTTWVEDVKKNNWRLNERAKIMEVIDDNEGYDEN